MYTTNQSYTIIIYYNTRMVCGTTTREPASSFLPPESRTFELQHFPNAHQSLLLPEADSSERAVKSVERANKCGCLMRTPTHLRAKVDYMDRQIYMERLCNRKPKITVIFMMQTYADSSIDVKHEREVLDCCNLMSHGSRSLKTIVCI